MKRTLKSNKGFSLVELIVVVLIMAIIAVALAPQVMKWVGNSRLATDANTYDSLFEYVQLILADEGVEADAKKSNAKMTFTMSKTGTTVTSNLGSHNQYNIAQRLAEVAGVTAPVNSAVVNGIQRKTGGTTAADDFVITVTGDGTSYKIAKTSAPDASGIK